MSDALHDAQPTLVKALKGEFKGNSKLCTFTRHNRQTDRQTDTDTETETAKGGGALCAGNAVALLVFGPVMP